MERGWERDWSQATRDVSTPAPLRFCLPTPACYLSYPASQRLFLLWQKGRERRSISLFFSPQHLSLSHSLPVCLHPLPVGSQRAMSTAGSGGAAHALGSLRPCRAPRIVRLLSRAGAHLRWARDARTLQATRQSLLLSWGGRGWGKRNQEAPLRRGCGRRL